jgi:hypothetical protein
VTRIVASEAAAELIRERGGRIWVWLDPHTWMGGTLYVYLQSAFEAPGDSRRTRRLRAARRPHRFHVLEGEGYEVHLEWGSFGPPEEVHLEVKRWPKRRVEAYWNGAVFAGEDIPPPDRWDEDPPGVAAKRQARSRRPEA